MFYIRGEHGGFMATDKILFDGDWIKVKEVVRYGHPPYHYAERKGVDSVAFVLVDFDSKKIGMIAEPKPPIQANLVTAFGGSFDGNEIQTPSELVINEVIEEAGFAVSHIARLIDCGKHFVSTQMNQWCYCYAVDVTDLHQQERKPQCKDEENAKVVWVLLDTLLQTSCWKAKVIALHLLKQYPYDFQINVPRRSNHEYD